MSWQTRVFALVCVLVALTSVLCTEIFAQRASPNSPGPKVDRYLTSLDADQNGVLQPSELSETARAYFTQMGTPSDMQVDRSYTIAQWKAAYETYHRVRLGAPTTRTKQVHKEEKNNQSANRGFGLENDQEMLPGFGAQRVKEFYNSNDLSNASSMLANYDANGNRSISKLEARRYELDRKIFDFDFNNDSESNLQEIAQYYARVRKSTPIQTQPQYSVPQPAERSKVIPAAFRRTRSDDESNDESRILSHSILTRHDRNRDRQLDETERRDLGIDSAQLDYNKDGLLTEDELDTWLYRKLHAQNEDLSGTLPVWFFEQDENADGQLEMSEFASSWSEDQVLQFRSLDTNRDGVLTSAEILKARSVVGTSFESSKAQFMPPYSTVVSEIEVREEFVVSDLNVQLSITHHWASHLDVYLVGPDGTRIELFAAVGKSENNFDQTILDDEAERPIVKSMPPFKGSYRPGALTKGQTSLSHYKNKSLRGVWQLIVKAERSDKYGVLHRWALIGKPQ